jgi:hypothetical protein
MRKVHHVIHRNQWQPSGKIIYVETTCTSGAFKKIVQKLQLFLGRILNSTAGITKITNEQIKVFVPKKATILILALINSQNIDAYDFGQLELVNNQGKIK